MEINKIWRKATSWWLFWKRSTWCTTSVDTRWRQEAKIQGAQQRLQPRPSSNLFSLQAARLPHAWENPWITFLVSENKYKQNYLDEIEIPKRVSKKCERAKDWKILWNIINKGVGPSFFVNVHAEVARTIAGSYAHITQLQKNAVRNGLKKIASRKYGISTCNTGR